MRKSGLHIGCDRLKKCFFKNLWRLEVMKQLLTATRGKALVGLLGLCVLVAVLLPVDASAFPAKDVPIPMYHKVNDAALTRYWVSERNLRYQLFLLKDLGYETVGYEDLYAHIMDVTELPAKPIILTFDDGYQNAYTHALPVFEEFSDVGFFGAAHIITDWVGDNEGSRRYNEWDTDANGPEPLAWHMIWPEVAALYDAGWTIEAHSRVHDSTSDPTYDPVYEAQSASVIGEKLGIPDPNFYVYPFGQAPTELLTEIQGPNHTYLGGVSAFGSVEDTNTIDIWSMQRFEITSDDTIDTFASKIGEVVPAEPRLTVNIVGGGSVEMSPDQPYYRDDPNVTLTATAAPYYTFAGWSGDLDSVDNPAVITMDSDKTVVANFVFEGTVLLEDGFEGTVWDANWSGTWDSNDIVVHSGYWSASANKDNDGTFASIDLDTTDAEAVCVDFWFRKDDTGTEDDFLLYYYDGTEYDLIADLDTLGGDDVWLHYTDIITDSQYFNPNFQILFDAISLTTVENVWVDDVSVIVQEVVVDECDAANLGGIGPVNFGDFAILASDWQLSGSGLAGDIDGDAVVDLEDLSRIALYWLSDCSQ
jgi:peptidoglycan/xylan/chitin deacetylase (PgdA/CDA1 family)